MLHAREVLKDEEDVLPIPLTLVEFLETKLVGCQISTPLVEGLHFVRHMNVQSVAVRKNAVPLNIKLHIAWGPVQVVPQVFAVLSSGDCSMVSGRVIMAILTICSNDELDRIVIVKHQELMSGKPVAE